MDTFKASVQYNDFKGTAAADNASDNYDLQSFLKGKGLMHDSEFLIASTLLIGESNAGKMGGTHVKAYLYDKADNNHDTVKAALDATTDPIQVRAVTVEVTAEQFICFFKRFNVMLTRPSLNIDGREFTEIE
jgi:hypothetical protein